MLSTICGVSCTECPTKATCAGCAETKGCPYGTQCFVAAYILANGKSAYQAFQEQLIREINALEIPGMEPVTALSPLVGHFVNLEYPLPGGDSVKLLRDDEMYLGTQVENLLDDTKTTCFGIIARESFLLVCEYKKDCIDPEIVVFKRR